MNEPLNTVRCAMLHIAAIFARTGEQESADATLSLASRVRERGPAELAEIAKDALDASAGYLEDARGAPFDRAVVLLTLADAEARLSAAAQDALVQCRKARRAA